jgi:hypothetical protein
MIGRMARYALVLSAPAVLVLQTPYARLFPAAFLAGFVAAATRPRRLVVPLLASAAAISPVVWHLMTPGTAAEVIAAGVDTGPLGAVDYLREFVLDSTPLRAWILLAYAALVGAAVPDLLRSSRRLPRGAVGRAVLAGAAAAALAAGAPRALERIREARGAWSSAQRERMAELRLLGAASSASPTQRRSPPTHARDMTLVLYVGESATRWNWSLYGYPRQTNAPLARHAATGRLVVVPGAVSSDAHPSSAPSEHASTLGFLHRLTPGGVVSLSRLLGGAGVHTAWIAPGARTGMGHHVYDDALLPELRAALRDRAGGRFVVVESHAGHFPFCGNTPPDRAVRWRDWLSRQTDRAIWGERPPNRRALDCYDAAMHYVSANLRDAMIALDALPDPAALIYVADHGEDVWRRVSRYSGAPSVRHREVPLLVYVNPGFTHRYPELLAQLQANRPGAFATAWLFDTILDLFGVHGSGTEGIFVPARSLVNPGFVRQGARLSPGADYVDRARQARSDYANGGRLCAHRANTVFKYLEAMAAFDCVEADVVLEQDAHRAAHPMVFHPPGPAGPERVNPQLDLAGLLGHAGLPRAYLWLDVKNLDLANTAGLLAGLDAVVPPERRGTVLVESPNLALARSAAADAIAGSGYTLSFYLPTETALGCARRFGPGCRRAARQLADSLRESGFRGISFDARGARLAQALSATLPVTPALNTWSSRWPSTPADLALLESVQMFLVEMPGGFDY